MQVSHLSSLVLCIFSSSFKVVSILYAIYTYHIPYTQTVSAITTFFLAMCLHPEIQVAAQAELDSVVGNERLPTMVDRPSLPYINSIVKEVLAVLLL